MSRRPPRIAEWLLGATLSPTERDEVLGDMAEAHARRAIRDGRIRAGLWYLRQALAIPPRLFRQRVRSGSSGIELRQTVRGLARSPGFTTVAVLSLGLGIGANTAIVSVVRSLLYTPLAVEQPDELRLVYYERPEGFEDITNFSSSQVDHPDTGVQLHSNYSYPLYERLREAAGADVDLMGFNFARQLAVVIDDQPAMAAAGLVASGDYFSTLRLPMAAGRAFNRDDDRPDATRVAVVGNAFAQRAFGGSAQAVGRTMRLNGEPFEVVGVTAPGFAGLSPGGFFAPTDITVPFATQSVVAPGWTPEEGSILASDTHYWVRLIARVPQGTETAPLAEAMTVALRETLIDTGTIEEEVAEVAQVHFIEGRRGLDSLRQNIHRPLAILAGVVAVVLLIACVNLAGLLLARGTARQHELAVRRALGAGRLRLIRQLLLESTVLAVAGGVVGLLIALWGGPAITAALTASLGRVDVNFQLDATLFGIVAAVSLAAALLCGLLPALQLTRGDSHDQLRTRALSGDRGARLPLGRALIAAQIAVSIPLLVGAGLFLRTLGNLDSVDMGFDHENLVIFRIEPTMVTSDVARIASIYNQVLRDTGELPGVQSATLLENALLSGWVSNGGVEIDGERVPMHMNAIGPDYFETMGVEIITGRGIEPTDRADAPAVVVVNETAEREVFGGNALGRVLVWGGTESEVVGVVADFKYDSLQAEVTPTLYDSFQQRRLRRAHVLLRTPLPPAQLERSIKDIVARVDPGLPVTGLRSQSDQIATALARERVFARLLAVFGGFALLIACIGLYGVTSFAVARRRAEIGVRMALGAREQQILWMVLQQVMVLAGVGLAVGLLASYLIGPVVGSMLYGLEPTDTTTLVGAAVVMLGVALLAGWLPALRASRTDALIALSRD